MKAFTMGILSTGLVAMSAFAQHPHATKTVDLANDPCQVYFTTKTGEEKQKFLYQKHLDSVKETLGESRKVITPQEYVAKFIGGLVMRGVESAEAFAATAQFLAPDVSENIGHRALKPTFNRTCELFEEPQTKKVHALGSLAEARLKLYDKIVALDENGNATKLRLENPWTGILNKQDAPQGVPLLVRFSIANPIAHTVKVKGKSLLLEFIPGLGLKFLIDKQKSVDLVAMESLAGQGTDQNFFKYEFSPDFAKNAPEAFNTSTGSAFDKMMARYNTNIVNHEVMSLVGVRFEEVVKRIMPGVTIDRKSSRGPHPFSISIEALAATKANGEEVATADRKRPWRLIFKPLTQTLPKTTRELVTDSTPYKPGKIRTDFRSKLAWLDKGDKIYQVLAETEGGSRYAIGEIVLESKPLPSKFADHMYFVQHQLEMNRVTNQVRGQNLGLIVEP